MILSTMRFAGYCWPHNPLEISVEHKLVTQVEDTAYEGQRITDARGGVLVVHGEGELVGKDCIEQYKALEKLFEHRRKGVLCLPGLAPFTAYFTKLSVGGQTTPDVLRYTFEFAKETEDLQSGEQYHICKEGQTLYDIAYDSGSDVDTLVRLNPWVRFPEEIDTGRRVRIC